MTEQRQELNGAPAHGVSAELTTVAPVQDIPALTGVRGIAAAWVAVYHRHQFDQLDGWSAVALRHGYLAVDLFFVLSGFVMALNYARFFQASGLGRNYLVFLMRRMARIYPLYLVTTLVATGIYLYNSSYHGLGRALLFNVLLIDIWDLSWPINGPSWSISVEMAAYLVFPALTVITIRKHPFIALATCVVALVSLFLISRAPLPPTAVVPKQGPLDIYWGETPWPLVRCLADFSIGLVTYRLSKSPVIRRVFALGSVTALVVAAIIGSILIKNADLLFVAIMPCLLLSLAFSNGWLSGALSTAPVLLLGQLSYAIYLLHFMMLPVQDFVAGQLIGQLGAAWANLAGLASFYLALGIVAWLCYDLIEVSGRRMIRDLEKRLFPAEDAKLKLLEKAATDNLVRR